MDAYVLALAERQADICKVFSSPTRILILWALGTEERTVSDVAQTIRSSLQNTSQHLRLMKDRGILASRREGHAVYYRIDGPEWLQACTVLRQAAEGLPTDGASDERVREPSLQEETS